MPQRFPVTVMLVITFYFDRFDKMLNRSKAQAKTLFERIFFAYPSTFSDPHDSQPLLDIDLEVPELDRVFQVTFIE